MKHHLLSSYFNAVLSVALAQFGANGFPCGMPGIIRLAEGSPYAQEVLESQMGMQLTEMKKYAELDPSERAHTVLPGAHPPVRGFYLIKPSPMGSAKPAQSGSLLRGLRLPKCPSSSQRLAPSPSMSDVSTATAPDKSLHSPVVKEHALDVVVNIDDTQLER